MSYTEIMKTAISLPDDLFQAAEELAGWLKMTRSGLYQEAIREYVARHRGAALTRAIDDALGDDPHTIDPAFERAQAELLEDEDW